MDILNSFGISVAAFIFVLGVMIFIHELGHHLMAKWLGIRVETFSLGFGPRLFGFRMGETDYRLSLLPLGGFVKMAGENVTDELTGDSGEFLSHPKRHRFLVAVAGPVMNLGLAVLLFAVTFMFGVRVEAYRSEPAVIGALGKDSAAARAGIRIGDKIVGVEGERIETWEMAEIKIGTRPNRRVILSLERDGNTFEQAVVTDAVGPSELGTIGVSPWIPYLIRKVKVPSPAHEAGLQAGDEVLEARVGDQSAQGFFSILQLVSSQDGETPVEFSLRREGREIVQTITPKQDEGRTVIGVYPVIPTVVEQYGFFESFGKSVERNYTVTVLLVDIIGQLVTGQSSIRQLSGPIDIARISGMAASQGAIPLMQLMAFISLQLGILNLLPIPILDGGVIALLGIEGLIRRDLSLRVKERIMQAGFIFLVLLMSVVIVNDISKLGIFGG